jgi:pimeloyl-ACP methyl ester carboxylesterase
MPDLHDVGGGVQLACTVTGHGPPLVLMHGAEGSHRMFDAIVPHLATQFTTIAYDQRDCGDSVSPATDASLADLADDARALVHALGFAKAHVYGSSFGGRVAQMLAHRHAETIDRLVLGSTWPLPQALEALNPEGVAQIHALRAKLPESAEALAELFLPKAFLDTRPELKQIFRNAQPQSERSLRRFRTVRDHPPFEPSAIDLPTLVIAGELDRVVPARVTKAMAATMPRAEMVLLRGVGHAGALQAPEAIAAHIRRFCLASQTRTKGAAT